MSRVFLKTIFLSLFCFTPVNWGSAAPELDFNRDIRPILSDKCFSCHGPDAHERKADLRFDTREGAMADLGGYAAIVPGNAEKSEFVARIVTDDPDDLMPPEDSHKKLKSSDRSSFSPAGFARERNIRSRGPTCRR